MISPDSDKIGREQGIIQPRLIFPIKTKKDKLLADYWETFDAIYCLSLRKRKDRQEQIRSVFSKLICPAQFYLCEKGKYSPAYHISNAHSDVSNHALKLGYKHILVFEDDAEPYPDSDFLSLLRTVVSFIKNNKYHFFFLGSFPNPITFQTVPTNYTNVYKLQGGWSQWHAYILSREGMKAVSRFQLSKSAKQGLDCFFNYDPERYAIFPMIFRQSLSPSNYVSDFGNNIKYKSSGPLIWWAFHIRINIQEIISILILLIIFIWMLRKQIRK